MTTLLKIAIPIACAVGMLALMAAVLPFAVKAGGRRVKCLVFIAVFVSARGNVAGVALYQPIGLEIACQSKAFHNGAQKTAQKLTLLDRIARIESNNNPSAIGDNGKSRGMFQMTEAAWIDVSAIRKAKGLPVYPWATGAHDARISRQYAADYLSILRNRLTRALNRAPSNAELYAAYSHGMTGFRRAGFSLNKTAKHIQRKAKTL